MAEFSIRFQEISLFATFLTLIISGALPVLGKGGNGNESSYEDINIKFKPKNIPGNPLYQPINRYEYGERNTSTAYTLWNETGVTLIEWPGNITSREIHFPLLRWNRKAKLVKNQCNERLGMNFFGYGHEYVHLSWGPFRMFTSYCPPIKIPRRIFKGTSLELPTSTQITASDFEFASDAFLAIIEEKFVVRVGNLEGSYMEEGSLNWDRNSLSYRLASGITQPINKLITQSCCTKFQQTCKDGNLVIAYRSESSDFNVYFSYNGAKDFKLISFSVPNWMPALTLQTLVANPASQQALVFYGSSVNSESSFATFSLNTGELIERNDSTFRTLKNVKGQLKSLKLGEEMSLVVWDDCKIWYSSDFGSSMIPAIFYYHNSISLSPVYSKESTKFHSILSKNCHLRRSSLTFDKYGKIGILDSMNNFFYGIDLKSSISKFFPLIATTVDMTLMKKGTENSIVPFFDGNSRPKLMYPPKYLPFDHPAAKQNYSKRLAVKLLPRTIFPSDFMVPFYEENIPKQFKSYGIRKCMTSGLTLDASISQKAQLYKTTSPIQFQLSFKSFSNSTDQLNIEPEGYQKYINLKKDLMDVTRMGEAHQFYFRYKIVITQKATLNVFDENLIRLNFYTIKSLRCIHQPQQTVWIALSEVNFFQRQDSDIPDMNIDSIEARKNYMSSEKYLHTKNPLEIQQCGLTYQKNTQQ